MVESKNIGRLPCGRCHGRMFADGSEGDLVCFSCGGVVYGTEPSPLLLLIDRSKRHPSHGGVSLS